MMILKLTEEQRQEVVEWRKTLTIKQLIAVEQMNKDFALMLEGCHKLNRIFERNGSKTTN